MIITTFISLYNFNTTSAGQLWLRLCIQLLRQHLPPGSGSGTRHEWRTLGNPDDI